MSWTQRKVSWLAVLVVAVVALAIGGLAVYLLANDSGAGAPQLVSTSPREAPAPAPAPLAGEPLAPTPAPAPLAAEPVEVLPDYREEASEWVAEQAELDEWLAQEAELEEWLAEQAELAAAGRLAPTPAPVPAGVEPGSPTVGFDIAESDVHPQVQQQGMALVEAIVEQFETAWPWVREAWERSDVRFYDRRLPAPCDTVGVVGCVRGSQLLLTLHGVQDEYTVLHELGHVWNNTVSTEWQPIRDAFAEHYAGCYSRRASTPERLQEELLVDAMVIASGVTIGDFSLGGFGYYEDGLWSDGFAGCLVDSSEPAPHLLTAIRRQLLNCGFDGEAAKAAAQAKADEESGSTFRIRRTVEEQRVDAWAALVPQVCADTPQLQGRTVQALEAVVAGHETPWPWLRAAWTASDIRFVDDLTAACPANSTIPLGWSFDDRGDPPAVACVRGTEILFALLAVQADEERLTEPLLQALARVWKNTANNEWAPIQHAFSTYYAGCYSDQRPTPAQLQEALIADTMVIATGAIHKHNFQGTGYQPKSVTWPTILGCDASSDPLHHVPLLGAVTSALFRCPYDDAAAHDAWIAAGGNPDRWQWTVTGAGVGQHWQRHAEALCGANA